ncbi:MAG: hypothetical protein HC831_05925 [Chloroflexia bacterium]|nr:hypothetical protein [Chloroflexia bacterium]
MIGGDSILSIQIIAEARKENVFLQPRHFFEHQTIAELALVAESGSNILAEQGILSGEVQLTPIQHYFFEQNFKNVHHWNQSVLLRVNKPLDKVILEQAFTKLIEHHDCLRLRFSKKSDIWSQQMAEKEENTVLEWIEVEKSEPVDQLAIFNNAQESLNLIEGPVIKAVFINNSSDLQLFITIHHLAVDGVSWRILVEDLQEIYLALSNKDEVKLAPKTTSYRQYAAELQKYASKYELIRELEYWKEQQNLRIGAIPVAFVGTENTEASVRKIIVNLDEALTKSLLSEANSAYTTRINDLLLAAMAKTLSKLTGQCNNQILLESHGREDLFENIDLTRTVGWFTSIYPVTLTSTDDNIDRLIKTVKETLHNVPYNGFNYGILKYLSGTKSKNVLSELLKPQLSFNYLGQLDIQENDNDLFSLKNEDLGSLHGPDNCRNHQIDVNAYVIDNKIHFDFEYSENLNRTETIREFANDYIESLQQIINYCANTSTNNYTPSDFADVDLDQDELDSILSELS